MAKTLYYNNGAIYALLSEEEEQYFYPDGTVKTTLSYAFGKIKSAALFWPNGKPKRSCFFLEGIRHGSDQMWTEEGVLVDEGTYCNGAPVGIHRRWDRQGTLIEEMIYLDPIRICLRRWDAEGVLRVEGLWEEKSYSERAWDRFQQVWIERKGELRDGKLVYLS